MSDHIRTISVRFTLTEYGRGADRRRSTVLMDVEARAEDVVALVSVQVGADGRLMSWTQWQEGEERMIRWDDTSRQVGAQPLPAAPTVTAVLEDVFGPLGDPEERGYRRVGPHSYEISEGLGVFRLDAPGGGLGARTFEAVDPRSGQVSSRIEDIVLGREPVVTAELQEMMAAVPVDGRTRFLRPGDG
ncbi:hypothetical protein [Nonomuraea zeae]|uniref:Uncharacterized protein n=1 Tax=Nonomuraea zeae TaxID=1642303 RepID=A0A5S4GC08_9ACTN|nr:hypothetical protein [Nonomuraea zeae]TMR30503.1 hypothetical protein ETD85_28845 [Nonomuraea zeae]